jgi:mannose-6-phosphate isomerase
VNVVLLDGVVRPYDWGSATAIPQLLGTEPDGGPVAELWFGAHPDSPSRVAEHGSTLDSLIERDPRAALGDDVIDRFGAQLPYLLKLLAAAKPLSIQVHPTLAQAQAGFAADDAAGVPRDAPERNYRDRNHKPELLCALTEFEALCGFRPVAQTRELLAELAVPELDFLCAALDSADPLRTAFARTLALPDPGPVVDALSSRLSDDGPFPGVARAARSFPRDVGVVLAVLLNHVRLAPGQAIFLGAGNVHAYLHGLGVEIMAASDNVLRCGFTSKHIDADEVLKVTDFAELPDPVWPKHDGAFTVPVPDFRLVPLAVDGDASLDLPGPRVVLCTEGAVDVAGVRVQPGHAAFVAAAAGAVPIAGSGCAFVAAVGDRAP